MFTNILVATDGSTLAEKAISTALALASSCGARLTALMVVPDYNTLEYTAMVMKDGSSADTLRQQLAEEGKKRLDQALAGHQLSGLKFERRVTVGDEPHLKILEQARHWNCDLIVMASRGAWRHAIGPAGQPDDGRAGGVFGAGAGGQVFGPPANAA
jgi:nucleotide-binding universal stress UspA family protein